MTTTWGTKPNITQIERANIPENETLERGYYVLESHQTFLQLGYGLNCKAKEQEFIQKFVQEFQTKVGKNPIYVEVRVYDGGVPGFYYDVDVTVVFNVNPIPLLVWFIIAIAVAIAVVVIAVGLTWAVSKVLIMAGGFLGGLGGVIMVLGGLGILAFVVLPSLLETRKERRKGRRR
jgi:hypothetical protein